MQPRLHEHFESFGKQEHAGRLGMWLFLASELLLFAALFGLYASYRTMYPEDFQAASEHNDVALGTTNTVVLITSSFTVAWSIHAIRRGRRRVAIACLLATVGFGFVFLALKSVEYAHHITEGILPGAYYSFHELETRGVVLFFTMYYIMTGLHALHVIAGMVFVAYAAFATWRGAITAEHNTLLENAGLYWHLVDLIWIYLWPLLYLLR